MKIIKIIALFTGAALIYRLQKKVDKLDEQLNSKNTVFKISGKDLVGILERQKNNDQVLKSDDGNTTVNLTDGTITVKPQK